MVRAITTLAAAGATVLVLAVLWRGFVVADRIETVRREIGELELELSKRRMFEAMLPKGGEGAIDFEAMLQAAEDAEGFKHERYTLHRVVGNADGIFLVYRQRVDGE